MEDLKLTNWFLMCICFTLLLIFFQLISIQKRMLKAAKESRNRELMNLFTATGTSEAWEKEHMDKLGKRIKELLDE